MCFHVLIFYPHLKEIWEGTSFRLPEQTNSLFPLLYSWMVLWLYLECPQVSCVNSLIVSLPHLQKVVTVSGDKAWWKCMWEPQSLGPFLSLFLADILKISFFLHNLFPCCLHCKLKVTKPSNASLLHWEAQNEISIAF